MNEQDRRVREYYENMSLPQDKLEMLLKIKPSTSSAENPEETLELSSDEQRDAAQVVSSSSITFRERLSHINPIQWRWHRWLPAGMACAAVLLTSLWMHQSSTESERMQRTVREVAMNHTTRLKPEYYGETLAKLDNSMQQLPFTLELPKSIGKTHELIGSRYCSLGGVLAAHVRLKSRDTGKPMSLFVTSNAAELEDIRSQQTTTEGVDVEFWREGGLFYAMAKQS